MKTNLLTLLALFSITASQAQTPRVDWSRSIGGIGNERANGVETDPDGNIILVGRFQSPSMQLDHVTLTKSAADHADVADIFIIKMSHRGEVLWALAAGGRGDDHATSCTTDSDGNIYVVGWFESETLTWGDISLKNNNCIVGRDSVRYNSDMWVGKFSPEGKCLWARHAGGLDGNGQYSTIALDAQNNVIISGIGGAKMDFGHGTVLTPSVSGMFVAKYSNDGRLLWAKAPEGKGEAQGVATDPQGNVIIGGYFVTALTLDDITIKSFSEGKGDAFIAKYSPEGKALWARSFGGEDGEIASCETDPRGNVYLGGLFFSPTINTDRGTLTNNGSINHFIAKYNPDGRLMWARSAGGNNGDGPATATREFYVDDNGSAFCTGSNWSRFSFAGDTIQTVAGSEDIFVLKYDTEGNEIWGMDFGGSGRNAGRGITTDRQGGIFLTGSFDEKQLKIQDHTLTNTGDSDIFIVKFTESEK